MKVGLNHLAIIQLHVIYSFDIQTNSEEQNGIQEGNRVWRLAIYIEQANQSWEKQYWYEYFDCK
jgi:hypothetical protein